MGKQYSEISAPLQHFIKQQKLFFVGTATADSRINISPKGMDSLRILDANRVAWLNVTGSGNETSAHIQQNPRMTLMFTAFEGKPLTLRLYGTASVIHHNDTQWPEMYALFPDTHGARQIFDLAIDMVQSSCGMSIPYYDYVGERELLSNWARKQGKEGIKNYWQKKNQTSIDGEATHIIEKNT